MLYIYYVFKYVRLKEEVTHMPVLYITLVRSILSGLKRSPQGMIQNNIPIHLGIHCPLESNSLVLPGRIVHYHENSHNRLPAINESYVCNQESLSRHLLYLTLLIFYQLVGFQLPLLHAQCDN